MESHVRRVQCYEAHVDIGTLCSHQRPGAWSPAATARCCAAAQRACCRAPCQGSARSAHSDTPAQATQCGDGTMHPHLCHGKPCQVWGTTLCCTLQARSPSAGGAWESHLLCSERNLSADVFPGGRCANDYDCQASEGLIVPVAVAVDYCPREVLSPKKLCCPGVTVVPIAHYHSIKVLCRCGR